MRLEIRDNVATVFVERSGERLNDATALVLERGYVLTMRAWTITDDPNVFTTPVRKDLKLRRGRG